MIPPFVCSLLILVVSTAGAERVALPVPPHQREHTSIGTAGTPPALAEMDREVVRLTGDHPYQRIVTHCIAVGSNQDPETEQKRGRYAVVDYSLPAELGQIGTGAEVWIYKPNGRWFALPKSAIRAANLRMTVEGIDLSRYMREVVLDGDDFLFRYSFRPDYGRSILDGQLSLRISRHTLRPVGRVWIGG